jgi:hypothetical protein
VGGDASAPEFFPVPFYALCSFLIYVLPAAALGVVICYGWRLAKTFPTGADCLGGSAADLCFGAWLTFWWWWRIWVSLPESPVLVFVFLWWFEQSAVEVKDLGDRGDVVVVDVVWGWFSLILDSLAVLQIC